MRDDLRTAVREVGEELRLELRSGLAGVQEALLQHLRGPQAAPPDGRPAAPGGGGGCEPAGAARSGGPAAAAEASPRGAAGLPTAVACKAFAAGPSAESSVLLEGGMQLCHLDTEERQPESPTGPRLHMVARNIHAMHGIARDSKVEPCRDGVGLGTRIRELARTLTQKHQTAFDMAIGLVILANSAFIGLEIELSLESVNDPDNATAMPAYISWVESVFLLVYVLELCVRVASDGRLVLRSGWFVFDFSLVCIGGVSHWILTPIVGDKGAGMTNQILLARNMRLVRLVRAVRMMELFADLWKLSVGLVRSSRTVLSACVLICLVGYIFGCVGIEWIGKSQPLRDDPVTGPIVAMYFGSIPQVLLTLIQFVNADSIGAIYTPLINKDPPLIIFFGGLIVVVTVLLMNLVTACIVESAVKTSTEDAEMARARVTKQIMAMAPKVEAAFNDLDVTKDGVLQKQELIHLARHMEHVHLPQELATLLQPEKMLDLFDVLDLDQDGRVTAPEFIEGICTLAFSHVPTETIQMLHLLRLQDRKLMALCDNVRALQGPLSQLQDACAGSAKSAGGYGDGRVDGGRPRAPLAPGGAGAAPIGRHKLPDAPVPTPAL